MKNKLAFLGLTIAILATLSGCTDQGQSQNQADSAKGQLQTGSTNTGDNRSNNDSSSSNSPSPMETNNKQLSAPVAGDTVAILDTDMGVIKFKLFTEQAPEITKNFIELSKGGKYKEVPFHRVVKDFMIQTGDFTEKNGRGGYSYKGPGTELDDEIVPSLKHLYGTVSMANHGPDTNGSQFFIVTRKTGTSFLDGGYSVFGQVYEGMDVALKIAELEVGSSEKPSKLINIKSVKIETVGK